MQSLGNKKEYFSKDAAIEKKLNVRFSKTSKLQKQSRRGVL